MYGYRRHGRNVPGWTLNSRLTRQQLQEYNDELESLQTNVDFAYHYIRNEFDAFVNRRIQQRLNEERTALPYFYINLRHQPFREALLGRYGFDLDDDPLSQENMYELFERLKIYLISLADSMARNRDFGSIFYLPSFNYLIDNRRHIIRLNNIYEAESLNTHFNGEEVGILNENDFHEMGSDWDWTTFGQQYADHFDLVQSIGLILPFRHGGLPEGLPPLPNRTRLAAITYRTRRYGAFYPFLLKREYKFFEDYFKKCQISCDKEDPIYGEHCLLYMIRQLPLEENIKQDLISGLFDHTVVYIDTVKQKSKVDCYLLLQLWKHLDIPYNLICRVMEPNMHIQFYGKKGSRHRIRNVNWPDINIFLDEQHFMYDFELPFTRMFAIGYNTIKREAEARRRPIYEYYNVNAFDYKKHEYITKPGHESKKLWMRELIRIAKKMDWFEGMSEELHNQLMQLPQDQVPGVNLRSTEAEGFLPVLYSEPKPKRIEKVFYFDFETLPCNNRHIPFLVVLLEADYCKDKFPVIDYVQSDVLVGDVKYDPNKLAYFYGWNCVDAMFEYLCSFKPQGYEETLSEEDRKISTSYDILLYAHNLMYDSRFIRAHSVKHFIEKSGRCFCQEHYIDSCNVSLLFKDFLAMSNCALKQLPSWYPQVFRHLKLEKELYNYDIIKYFINEYATEEDNFILQEKCSMSDLRVMLREVNCPDQEAIEFMQHYVRVAEENGFFVQGEFDFIAYTIFYCVQDCRILKVAHQNFRHEVKTGIINLNIDYCLTAPSLARRWFERELFSPLKRVYKIRGSIQDFILKACHGGRCMTARNRKMYVNTPVLNVDAVSLYPSAMNRMYIPFGIPQVIPQDMCMTENQFDKDHPHPLLIGLFDEGQVDNKRNPEKYIAHFVVEIEITSVGKYRDFPCIVRKEKDGKHNTNTCGIVYCDCIHLQDMIKYHWITYRVIRGVWWVAYEYKSIKKKKILVKPERSYKINWTIQELFNLRKQLKAEKNPQEKIVKLLLNSGFGTMMQHPVKVEHIIKTKDEMQGVFSNEFNNLKYFEQITDEHNIESDLFICSFNADKSKHVNLAYLAALVLSYSKNIMNKLMYDLEDAGVKIYYTDTDSMHVDAKGFLEFVENSNEPIIGNNMGQFHNDYDGYGLGIYNQDRPSPGDDLDLYASEAYYLSKKIYCERVVSKTYPDVYGVFFRLKGVPEQCIVNFANNELEGDILSVYAAMYSDWAITFDIAATKPVFRFGSDYIYNLTDFTRTIKCRYERINPECLTKHIWPIEDDSEYCVIKETNSFQAFNCHNRQVAESVIAPDVDISHLGEYHIEFTEEQRRRFVSRFAYEQDEEAFDANAQELYGLVDNVVVEDYPPPEAMDVVEELGEPVDPNSIIDEPQETYDDLTHRMF